MNKVPICQNAQMNQTSLWSVHSACPCVVEMCEMETDLAIAR